MSFCNSHSLYKNMNCNYQSTSCGYYNDIDIPFDSSDYYLKIEDKYNCKPGLLAYDLYGDERFSWVFTYFNRSKVNNPIFDLTTGKIIIVPTRERLLKYF